MQITESVITSAEPYKYAYTCIHANAGTYIIHVYETWFETWELFNATVKIDF